MEVYLRAVLMRSTACSSESDGGGQSVIELQSELCSHLYVWPVAPPPENSLRWSLVVSVAVSDSKMITVLKTNIHALQTRSCRAWNTESDLLDADGWAGATGGAQRAAGNKCRHRGASVTLLMSNSRGLLLCSSFLSTTLFTLWWRAASSQSEQSWNFCVRLELDTEFILHQHKGIDQHAALS